MSGSTLSRVMKTKHVLIMIYLLMIPPSVCTQHFMRLDMLDTMLPSISPGIASHAIFRLLLSVLPVVVSLFLSSLSCLLLRSFSMGDSSGLYPGNCSFSQKEGRFSRHQSWAFLTDVQKRHHVGKGTSTCRSRV